MRLDAQTVESLCKHLSFEPHSSILMSAVTILAPRLHTVSDLSASIAEKQGYVVATFWRIEHVIGFSVQLCGIFCVIILTCRPHKWERVHNMLLIVYDSLMVGYPIIAQLFL